MNSTLSFIINKPKTLGHFLLFLLLLSGSFSHAFSPIQNERTYQVYLDLNEVTDDKLPVQIVPPVMFKDSLEFHMPRIIPGTYDVHNYGRFVSNFKALDASGNELNVKRLDLNRWEIYEGKRLYKITYLVDDTYDHAEKTGIFEPAGTSLEEGVFLLNNFGFVGYLDGFKDYVFELQVEKPKGFYGSTALIGEMGDTLDVFQIKDYFTLHDNPLMYNVPDTASRMVGETRVLVSVYSPAKAVSAQKSMESISKVLDAAELYLGALPVEKYAVLIYTVPLDQVGASYGALEHQTSTVLYMPEFEDEQFYNGVRDITSHEFFHIVTPLGIHSEMIANFDFINPKMSKHIWLYEGVTEYNSHLVQVRAGIYDVKQFLDVVEDKMTTADDYELDVPLTVASEFTLTFMKNQYQNFYQKGALAGMAIDLKLLKLSNGNYRLIDLLDDLGDTYGADTFFIDADLFDIIAEATYPEMMEFFARHFEGSEPFPFQELLDNMGILYVDEYEAERFSIGNVDLGYNFETSRLRVEGAGELDEFGEALGWQEGDEIISFNGWDLNLENISEVISDFYTTTEEGQKITIIVARLNDKGDYKTVKLKAKAILKIYEETHLLQIMETPTSSQLEMRKKWLNQ